MRIADVANQVGTSPRMLRYYETQGLLAPARSESGYRDYSDQDLRIARQITTMSSAGLTLAEIKTVLPCALADGAALRACPQAEPELHRRLGAIRARISTLTTSAAAIETYLATLHDGPGATANVDGHH